VAPLREIGHFFDLVLQIEYVNSYFGFKNTTLGSGGFKLAGWNSPSNHVFYNSLTQAVIIGSRVEFERLMRFIYFAFEGNEVRGPKTGRTSAGVSMRAISLAITTEWH
jgi:hypothetical protein